MQEVKQPNKKPFIFYYMIALIVIILINSLLVPQLPVTTGQNRAPNIHANQYVNPL